MATSAARAVMENPNPPFAEVPNPSASRPDQLFHEGPAFLFSASCFAEFVAASNL
jgi:hypothetical protein